MYNIAIIGPPRSGTSLVANLIHSAGFSTSPNRKAKFFGASEMNLDGYFEDVEFVLLNDQLMRQGGRLQQKISFLNPPDFLINDHSIQEGFKYDIDEKSLEVPDLYEDNLFKYFIDGRDWWGLTKMSSTGKWYKAYQAFKLDSSLNIAKKLKLYSDFLKNITSPTFLKDPRLTFTLGFFNGLFKKVIWVERSNINSHLKSLKRHYGKNFLSNASESGFTWSVNHFNYKPEPMGYPTFISRYVRYKKYYETEFGDNFLQVNYDDLISKNNKNVIVRIEEFINSIVDKDLIKK